MNELSDSEVINNKEQGKQQSYDNILLDSDIVKDRTEITTHMCMCIDV